NPALHSKQPLFDNMRWGGFPEVDPLIRSPPCSTESQRLDSIENYRCTTSIRRRTAPNTLSRIEWLTAAEAHLARFSLSSLPSFVYEPEWQDFQIAGSLPRLPNPGKLPGTGA